MATNAELIAAIDQAIAGNTDGIQTMEIRGRRITYMSLAELLKVRQQLKAIQNRSTVGGFVVAGPARRRG